MTTAPAGAASLRGVARGGAVNMAAASAGAAVNFGLVIVVTRSFSPDAAGVFFSATSLMLIVAAIANLGTPSGLVYFVARVRALGAAGLVPRVLRLAFAPLLVVSVVVGAALFAAAPALAGALGGQEGAAYLRLLALFLPFAVFTDAALAATRGFHDMGPTAVLEKVGRPLAQLALLGAVSLSGAAGLLAVAWAGPFLPAALLAWWWLRRIRRRHDSGGDGGPAKRETVSSREFWSFTLPRAFANIAQIGIQRSGIVLVAALRGAADAALFTAATRFIVLGQFAAQAIQFAVQPRLTELLATDDRGAANQLFQTSTCWLICLTWPLYLPVIVFAPVVLRVFGDGYAVGAHILVVIAVAMLLSSACGMADLALTVAGRTRYNLINNVVALALNLTLCLLLIPQVGVMGAAAAWAAAVAVRNLLPVAQLSVQLGLRPWSRTGWQAMAATAVWFGAVPLLCRWLLGPGIDSLAAALALGGAGYLATLWRMRTRLHLNGILSRR